MKNPIYYGKKIGSGKFHTYENGYSEIQIRCVNPPHLSHMGDCVAAMATVGGQYASPLTHRQSKRLARKIVRLLNQN